MQSVLPRRRQHAISYVLARGSMDRVDRAQGIRLIARANPVHRFYLAVFLFSLSISPYDFLPLPFSLSRSLVPRERNFYGGNDFQFGPEASVSFSPLRSHECIRADYNADAIRNCGEFATLALNTLRRAAVTSQSELQTKRLAARPNTRDVYFPRQFLIPRCIYSTGR